MPDNNKKKVAPKKNEKWSDWKPVKKKHGVTTSERKTEYVDNRPSGKPASEFDSAFASAKKAGKKEFTHKGKRYTTTSWEPRTQKKVEYNEIKKMPTRSTPIPPVKSKRTLKPLITPDTPTTTPVKTNLKAKKVVSKPRTYKSFGTGGKAKVKAAYASVNPFSKSAKSGKGKNPIYGKTKRLKNVVSRETSVKDEEGTQVAQGSVIKRKGSGGKTSSNFKKMKYKSN